MIKNVFYVLIFFLIAGSVHSQVLFKKPLSPRTANYQIQAVLDVNRKEIKGHEILTWRNTSRNPIQDLQFHLYMNAFKNNRSTLFREMGGRTGVLSSEKAWGWIDILSIKLRNGATLKPSLQFIQPDNDNRDDQTVCRVVLPRPVQPGEEIRLEIDFLTRLPRIFMRTGYWKEFFIIGQWFPKIGVAENGKWNCHQFHSNSEFFADFGVYAVDITLPKKFIVGATGILMKTVETDSNKTLSYRAEDVHDFAWTAWPYFRNRKETHLGIEINLLYDPNHEPCVSRYMDAMRKGLDYYSRHIGQYPYPVITLVDPPQKASRAGGMEYPTLIIGLSHRMLPRGFRLLESLTIHEFGHNYWYGLVANNEFEEAWLDEGIASYFEMKIMDEGYGKDASSLDWFGLRMGEQTEYRSRYIGVTRKDRILRNAWTYIGGGYGIFSYYKPALMLLTLENEVGWEKMNRIMRTYFERWKFKHPHSEDFIQIVNEISGSDYTEYFDQALRGSIELDYAVAEISTEEAKDPEGVFDEDGRKKETKPSILYHSIVTLQRKGEMIMPVDVLVVFDKKDTVREKWDGKERWIEYEYNKPNKLISAEIDPERKWVLDSNFSNNSKTLKSRNKPIQYLFIRFLFWTETLLHGFAFFG